MTFQVYLPQLIENHNRIKKSLDAFQEWDSKAFLKESHGNYKIVLSSIFAITQSVYKLLNFGF